ncbi:MAG: PAS domain S-box protein [Actinomycetota bacterium]
MRGGGSNRTYDSGIDALAPDSTATLFRALFESSPDGLLLVRGDGTVRLANPAAAALFGLSPDELATGTVERLVPESVADVHVAHRRGFFADPDRRPMGTGLQLFAKHADGSLFPVEISLSPVDVDGEPMVIAAIRDVTERQETQANVGLLEERERIARDIHDMVIQRVFAAGMSLQAVFSLIDNPVARDRVASVTEELDETIHELRSAIFRLGTLDEDRTFGAQVRSVLDERSRVLGFVPELVMSGSFDQVPSYLAEQLLATLTEALSNVARHAAANNAHVEICQRGDEVSLTVADDGLGVTGEPKPRGGLSNMMWRAAELGGQCSVERNEPTGTRVTWRVPV